MDTGRAVEFEENDGTLSRFEIDSDVLITEQRLIDKAGFSPEDARVLAPQLVDAALNTVCPCCAAEDGHGKTPRLDG